MSIPALARDELVAPFPDWIETGAAWSVVWPRRRLPNRHAARVLDWIETCAADARTAWSLPVR